MFKKLLAAIVLFGALLSCFGVVSPSVHAEGPPTRVGRMTLLGDSYSAGNGAGDYDTAEPGAYRSRNNWAHHYRYLVEREGVHAPLTVLAHSGDIIEDVLNYQAPAIPANSDIVMFTIGGNDGGFGPVVQNCFARGLRNPIVCKKSIEAFRGFIQDSGPQGLRKRTGEVFSAISRRLDGPGRDRKQMVLLGYPNLVLPNADSYFLHGCEARRYGGGCRNEQIIDYPAGAEILEAAKELARMQQAAVDDWNRYRERMAPTGAKIPKAHYIDTIQKNFKGHEPDPSAWEKNDYRWVNEFFETEGYLAPSGKTESNPFSEMKNWYHPNKIGHRQIGLGVVSAVGVAHGDEEIQLLPARDQRGC